MKGPLGFATDFVWACPLMNGLVAAAVGGLQHNSAYVLMGCVGHSCSLPRYNIKDLTLTF